MCAERQSYHEKREFLRIPVVCELALQEVPDGKCFSASSRDLSAGGVLFHVEERLQPGDRLEMHIGSGQPLFTDLNATIEVVRVEQLSDSGGYAVGSAIRMIHGRTG